MAKTEKFKVADVEAALREAHGNVAATRRIMEARHGRCAYNTVKNYIQRHPSLKAVQNELESQFGDLVENKIHSAILSDDGQMIRFYAATKLKDRGYGHRVEATGKNGGPIEIVQNFDFQTAFEKLSEEERNVLRKVVEKAVDAD